MAYVRQRGNQLAIVQGSRDPKSKKVEQEILFTLYSKGEALEAIGKRSNGNAVHFRSMLESQHPQVKFNWKAIEKGIADNLEVLPDLYDYRTQRLQGRFREDLRRFTKHLLLADSQMLVSAAQLITEHRYELEYLQHLIDWRLKTSREERNEWNGDNPFYWRFSMRGHDPGESEELVASYYERGDLDRAKAIFQLFTEMFDGYAEGHNYLGLIALDRRQLDEAISQFEKTIELGRRLFPKKIAKSRYWQDHATRPYMRGLMNLTSALNRAGRYVEALAHCDRLENECGDRTRANMRRAAVYLNTNQWQLAWDTALPVVREGVYSRSIVAALAAFELGQRQDATLWFVHAVATRPRAVAMVLDVRMPPPSNTHHEVQDHNDGVSLGRDLSAYLETQRKDSRSFFRHLWKAPEIEKMRTDVAAAGRRWFVERTEDQKDFELFTRSETLAFAQEVARRAQEIR